MLSPPLMITLPSGSAGGFYSTWQPYTEATSPTSGSFSPVSPISRQSSPFPAISGFVNERSSWPSSVPLSDRQISESDSMPLSFATSMSYTVKSVNSRKSRLTVRYPRPVRPLLQSSIRSSLESLASRPSSASPARARPVADQEHVAQALATMSALFEPLPDSQPLPVEKRLTASWHSLLKMKAYEEIHCAPNMRATRSYADALHCIHGEIVGSDAAGAPELVRPCDVLNE
ncbi:hypothetical protein BC834DRAFT_82302 [Gloeopeniophorella convolvens]|nr:hypothetical protein BC834DRAFT_82302 [Gloeopeniophorella convolvens]